MHVCTRYSVQFMLVTSKNNHDDVMTYLPVIFVRQINRHTYSISCMPLKIAEEEQRQQHQHHHHHHHQHHRQSSTNFARQRQIYATHVPIQNKTKKKQMKRKTCVSQPDLSIYYIYIKIPYERTQFICRQKYNIQTRCSSRIVSSSNAMEANWMTTIKAKRNKQINENISFIFPFFSFFQYIFIFISCGTQENM